MERNQTEEYFRQRAAQIRKAIGLTKRPWTEIPNSLLISAFTMRGVELPEKLTREIRELHGTKHYEYYEYLGDQVLDEILEYLVNERKISSRVKRNLTGRLRGNIFLYYLADLKGLMRLIITPADVEVTPWKAGADIIESILGLLSLYVEDKNLVRNWFIETFDIMKYFDKLVQDENWGPSINGKYGPWGPWSSCSNKCGSGLIQRKRECDNPPREKDGLSCEGPAVEEKTCSSWDDCPGEQQISTPRKPPGLRSSDSKPIFLGSIPISPEDPDYMLFCQTTRNKIKKFSNLNELYKDVEKAAYDYDLNRLKNLLDFSLDVLLEEITPGKTDLRLKAAILGVARASNSKLLNILVKCYDLELEDILYWLWPTGNLLLIKQIMHQLFNQNSDDWFGYLESSDFQGTLWLVGQSDNMKVFKYLSRAVPDLGNVFYSIGQYGNIKAARIVEAKQTSEYILAGLEGAVQNYNLDMVDYFLLQKPNPETTLEIYENLIHSPTKVTIGNYVLRDIKSVLENYLKLDIND